MTKTSPDVHSQRATNAVCILLGRIVAVGRIVLTCRRRLRVESVTRKCLAHFEFNIRGNRPKTGGKIMFRKCVDISYALAGRTCINRRSR